MSVDFIQDTELKKRRIALQTQEKKQKYSLINTLDESKRNIQLSKELRFADQTSAIGQLGQKHFPNDFTEFFYLDRKMINAADSNGMFVVVRFTDHATVRPNFAVRIQCRRLKIDRTDQIERRNDRPLKGLEVERPEAFVDGKVVMGWRMEISTTEHQNLILAKRNDGMKFSWLRKICSTNDFPSNSTVQIDLLCTGSGFVPT